MQPAITSLVEFRLAIAGASTLAFASKMKIIQTMVALLLFAQHGAAEQPNIPAATRLDELTKIILIPRINYEKSPGVEILEFIRSKIWSISLIDGDSPRPAHKYQCSPDRLLKQITFKHQNVSYGDALTKVCQELGITWSVERGTIVFSDVDVPDQKKSEQAVTPNGP
jgi:hypothetical protein